LLNIDLSTITQLFSTSCAKSSAGPVTYETGRPVFFRRCLYWPKPESWLFTGALPSLLPSLSQSLRTKIKKSTYHWAFYFGGSGLLQLGSHRPHCPH
jgi:hypothetical protein